MTVLHTWHKHNPTCFSFYRSVYRLVYLHDMLVKRKWCVHKISSKQHKCIHVYIYFSFLRLLNLVRTISLIFAKSAFRNFDHTNWHNEAHTFRLPHPPNELSLVRNFQNNVKALELMKTRQKGKKGFVLKFLLICCRDMYAYVIFKISYVQNHNHQK